MIILDKKTEDLDIVSNT